MQSSPAQATALLVLVPTQPPVSQVQKKQTRRNRKGTATNNPLHCQKHTTPATINFVDAESAELFLLPHPFGRKLCGIVTSIRTKYFFNQEASCPLRIDVFSQFGCAIVLIIVKNNRVLLGGGGGIILDHAWSKLCAFNWLKLTHFYKNVFVFYEL